MHQPVKRPASPHAIFKEFSKIYGALFFSFYKKYEWLVRQNESGAL